MPDEEGPGIEAWYAELPLVARASVEGVDALVSGADPRMRRAVKWKRLTFALDGNWHHWLCGVAVTAKAQKLVFHKGALLDDPAGMLRGSGRYVRELPLDDAWVRREDTHALIRSARVSETDMLD